jgi:4-amino-4-deoxy-L-arabinose transferase-like glycosyltransferase
VVLLALIVRAAVVVADTGYRPEHDAFDYDRHARSIASGEGYPQSGFVVDGGPSALRPPVYPYLLGAVYAVTGDSVDAGRFANVALGGLSVLLLFLIGRRIWGRRVGLVAAALAAVFPPLVLLSRDLLSESLFIAMELAAVLCILEFRRSGEGVRWPAAAGILCGVGALTRNPGIALAIPIAYGAWMLRPAFRPRSLLPPAVVAACTILVILPWTVRNAVDFGRFVPLTSSLGFALAGTYNQESLDDDLHPGSWRTPVVTTEYGDLFHTPGIDEGTLDATMRRQALRFAWDHPGYVAEVAGENLLRLFELQDGSVVGAHNVGGRLVADPRAVSTGRGIGSATPASERAGLAVAGVLALLGVVAIARTRAADLRARIPRGPWFLWLVPVIMILAATPINGLPRYRVPADPFLLILAAIGLVWLWDFNEPSRRRLTRRAGGATAASVVVVVALAGCGGGNDDTHTPTTVTAPNGPEKQRYIARADAVCKHGIAEARALGRNFVNPGGSALQVFTERLVRPGIPILERFAARLRAIQPRPQDTNLETYLGLFDPGIALLKQRLRAGERDQLEESQNLELLLVSLGDEQRELGRRFGFRACNVDFLSGLTKAVAQ